MGVVEVTELLERLCSLLRADARQRGLPHALQPVQVEALLYLDRCNRYSDTPQAVAEFLGLTKGTVSQTLKVLERHELVVKRQDATDRRKVRLELTPAGRWLAQRLTVPEALEHAVEALGFQAGRLEEDLRSLLAAIQRASGIRTFGTCRSCRFFRREAPGFRCGLTGDPLSSEDSDRLCVEHEPVA